MKAKCSYLVSADGWPMKYIRANTAAEARRRWQKMTGGPKNPPSPRCSVKSRSAREANNRAILEPI